MAQEKRKTRRKLVHQLPLEVKLRQAEDEIEKLAKELARMKSQQRRFFNGQDPLQANTFLVDFVHDDLPLGSGPLVRFGGQRHTRSGDFSARYDGATKSLTVKGGLGIVVRPVVGNEVQLMLRDDK